MIKPSSFNVSRVNCMKKIHLMNVFRHTETHQQVGGSRDELQAQFALSPGSGPLLAHGGDRKQNICMDTYHLLQQLPSYECLSAWHQVPPGCCWPPKVATSALGNIRRSLAATCVQHSHHLGRSQHLGNINSKIEISCMEEQQCRGYFELLPAQDKWG